MPIANYEPMPPYFFIRINKEKQSERKGKSNGGIIIPETIVYETRNMQQGEIVAIGQEAAEIFPQAKIGHTLITHWMTESKDKNQLIYADETYNYYVVTSCEHNGQANQSYAVWDGEHIIPHPDYVFLVKKDEERQLTETKSGLLLFNNWEESRPETEARMNTLSAEIQSLSKSKMSDTVKKGIASKEQELNKLSNKINKKFVDFYEIAAINPDLSEYLGDVFGDAPKIGDKIGILNIATQTTVEFMGIEYITALSRHIHCTYQWAKDAVDKTKTAVETAV